jgi:hypothetical protein
MNLMHSRLRFAPAGLVGALLLTACGGDDKLEPAAYEIRAVDYSYGKVPEKVAAGSTFTLVNDSTGEVHEIYAGRLPDDETRPVSELLQLPFEEIEAIETDDAFVLIALPGEEGEPVLGNGTFFEPGRYVLVCFIPTGADPEAVLKAIETDDEEPDLGDGAPHFTQGMFAEITVE